MDKLRIVTNNIPRNLLYGYELTAKEARDFDYIDSEYFSAHPFFRYRGQIYDVMEFSQTVGAGHIFDGWDRYQSDSFFSGILVRFPFDPDCGMQGETDYDRVIVATYYC